MMIIEGDLNSLTNNMNKNNEKNNEKKSKNSDDSDDNNRTNDKLSTGDKLIQAIKNSLSSGYDVVEIKSNVNIHNPDNTIKNNKNDSNNTESINHNNNNNNNSNSNSNQNTNENMTKKEKNTKSSDIFVHGTTMPDFNKMDYMKAKYVPKRLDTPINQSQALTTRFISRYVDPSKCITFFFFFFVK
jgi:hypothetical protein